MRLQELYLLNFQGIIEASFDFGGSNANIYGDNAVGKTTIFNAVTWLLFGKASTGAKNYTPKTKGETGDLHYLDHGVEAKFTLDDGQIITLRKVYKEDWKKKRGSAQEEFSGHVVEYFIDGVPVKEKEYIAALENYIGKEERVQMLMMPDYFSEVLHWEQRRRILLEMCGDVSDEDVIAGTPKLADLLDYLAVPGAVGKHYSVDEYKKIADGKRKDINKQLQALPARIDEAKKAMPNVTGLALGPLNAKIAMLNSQIQNREREKQETLSGDAATENIRKEIAALTTKIAEERAAYATANSKANEAAVTEVGRLRTEASDIRSAISEKKSTLTSKQRELAELNRMRQAAVDSYNRVNAEAWKGDETCPTCMRPLPDESITQAKEQFNLGKSQRLEAIKAEIAKTCGKDMVAAVEKVIADLEAEIAGLEENLHRYDSAIPEAEAQVKTPAPFESTETYTTITAQINDLRNNETKAGSMVANQIALIDTNLAELRSQLEERMTDKSKLAQVEQQQKRIEELAAEEKTLSAEYENLQRGVYLCEEFVKAKVSMLTDKINSRFETVRFRLFVEQINGGIKEDCEVMVPGDAKMVPYSYANNAARINAGLEIINALAQHWGISVPVFVDNAESVTRLQEIEGQLIRLVVSEPDKTLRMEVTS